jgi:acetoacetyl-CoA reductase
VLEKIVARFRSDARARRRDRPRVAFLVADDGGFVTGSTLSINGGQHMY